MLRLACPIFAGVCLALGLAMAGQALPALAALLAGGSLLFTRRQPFFWLATGALIVLVALAVLGTMLNAAPILMLLGAAAALAGWDLAVTEIERPANDEADAMADGLLERCHLRLLGLALGAGLLAGAVGQYVQVQLPFIVVVLLAGLGVWALERVFKTLGQ
jgi:hypothetical protein